jgi:5-methylthioadenosine/S-adenosylhomocysteine deaminase
MNRDPTADLQIDAGCVLRIEPRAPLHGHSIVVRDGTIVDLLPTAEADAFYRPVERVVLPQHIVLPGLVNAHCHAAMTLLRGIADDLPLKSWLEDEIWPREGRHVSPEFVHDGSLLAAAEMLRGGVTTCCDMYFFPDATAAGLRRAGMRVQLGLPVLEFPSAYAPNADAYLQRGLEVRDALRDDPLVSFALAPHAPYTVSDATFAKIVTYADELGLAIQTHLHETDAEVSDSVAAHGQKPLSRLHALGALGPGFLAIHAVHCDDNDIGRLARQASNVAHCPSSNLKLGSGVASIARMRAAGINVALGTDGAASNNRLDLFEEMRIAALLAKGTAHDPTVLPAADVVEMATLGGARALGLEQSIGAVAPGRYADLIAVSVDNPESAPLYDPYSHLVFVAGRADVTHAWVAGRPVVTERHLTGCDLPAILRNAAYWQEKLRHRQQQG